jgi:hypothetical protein
MKTAITAIALFAFSALILSPCEVAVYPPKKVIVQRNLISKQEIEINSLINKIEFEVKSDSVIKAHKHAK